MPAQPGKLEPAPTPVPRTTVWLYNEQQARERLEAFAARRGLRVDGPACRLIVEFLLSPETHPKIRLVAGSEEAARQLAQAVLSAPAANSTPVHRAAGHCDLCGLWDTQLIAGVGACCRKKVGT